MASTKMSVEMTGLDNADRRRPIVRTDHLEDAVPCPPAPVADHPVSARSHVHSVDTVVVGGRPLGAATAWHLARRGVDVLVLERRQAGQVWRSAGPGWWAATPPHERHCALTGGCPPASQGVQPPDMRWHPNLWDESVVHPDLSVTLAARRPDERHIHPNLLSESAVRTRSDVAVALWREVEDETGAVLLQAAPWRVRADQAAAALTAAAIGRGAQWQADAVRAVEVEPDGLQVRVRGGAVHAQRLVLVGDGPVGLLPRLRPATEPCREGPVVAARGARSFAVPLLGQALADLAVPARF
jgi:sarcosine oxidase